MSNDDAWERWLNQDDHRRIMHEFIYSMTEEVTRFIGPCEAYIIVDGETRKVEVNIDGKEDE